MAKHTMQSITAEGLSKSFGRLKVIDDLDLQLFSGDIATIHGRNGSGKTTLLSMLSTLTLLDKGHLRYCRDGLAINDDLISRTIGYMSHKTFLYQSLTVLENLEFFAKLYSIRDVKLVIEEKSRVLNVQDQLHKRVATLSHGQRKRISIIRSLLHSPTILIMDEPETGLDQESISLLRNFIISFAETGGIAVIASHTSEVDYGEDQKRYQISSGRLLKGF